MSGAGTGSMNLAAVDLPMEERETGEQLRARMEAKAARSFSPWANRPTTTEPLDVASTAPTRHLDAAAIVGDYIAGMTIPKIAKTRGHTRTTIREILDDTPGLVRRDDRATNGAPPPTGRPATSLVRAWAIAQGLNVPTKGILKGHHYDDYTAAHPAGSPDIDVTPEPDPVTPEPAPVTPEPAPVTPDVDDLTACARCYDRVSSLSSRGECDGCVAELESTVHPPAAVHTDAVLGEAADVLVSAIAEVLVDDAAPGPDAAAVEAGVSAAATAIRSLAEALVTVLEAGLGYLDAELGAMATRVQAGADLLLAATTTLDNLPTGDPQ